MQTAQNKFYKFLPYVPRYARIFVNEEREAIFAYLDSLGVKKLEFMLFVVETSLVITL